MVLRQHFGYGTRAHLLALVRLGPSPIHRRSFNPLRSWLSGELPFGVLACRYASSANADGERSHRDSS